MIDLIKLFICLVFLLYSCRRDLKTRTVPNELWGVVFVAALPLVVMDALIQGSSYLLHTAVSVVGIYVFVYVLFWAGAFGGADAKALIALSFIFPDFPDISVVGYGLPLSGVPPLNIFAFSTLANTVLLTLIVPLGLLAYNLCTLSVREILKDPWYLAVGYKCKISDLNCRHVRLIKDFECDDGVVKNTFARIGVGIDDQVVKRLEQLASRGLIGERVWVTPGLPFMIPITAGFISAVVYGDLIVSGTMMLL